MATERTDSIYGPTTCDACGGEIGARDYRLTWRLRTDDRVTELHYCSEECFSRDAPDERGDRDRRPGAASRE